MSGRLDREYFEGLYAASGDPWNFETSDYEREKYRRTIEVLGDRRFRRALEAGASIGVFTEMLAGRCDALLAVDVSEKAVAAARERLAGLDRVRVERRTLPEEMLQMLDRFEAALAPGGALLAVHWRRETRTYPLQGDEVHELLAANTRLTPTESVAEPDYRLDLFEDHP